MRVAEDTPVGSGSGTGMRCFVTDERNGFQPGFLQHLNEHLTELLLGYG